MTVMKKVTPRELFLSRLRRGTDLLEEITRVCRKENISLGRVEALGAVERARLAFYDQKGREYRFFTIDRPLEITKLIGNVSLKDGSPFVHAHITLADEDGKAYGGHLAAGTVVFACEVILEAFEGADLERKPDEETGLSLWTIPE